MEISRVVYIKDARKKLKLASWFYGEPRGVIVSRAYEEEDPNPPLEVENGGGETEAAENDDAMSEDSCPGKIRNVAADELVFIVYHVSRWNIQIARKLLY